MQLNHYVCALLQTCRSWTLPNSRKKAQIQGWRWSPRQGASEQGKEVFSVKHAEGNKFMCKAHSGCYEVALWKGFTLFGIPRITLPMLGNPQANSKEHNTQGPDMVVTLHLHTLDPHGVLNLPPWAQSDSQSAPHGLQSSHLYPADRHFRSLSGCWQIVCSKFFGGAKAV